MNFVGKWVEIEKAVLNEVTQTQKDKCSVLLKSPSSKCPDVNTFCSNHRNQKLKKEPLEA